MNDNLRLTKEFVDDLNRKILSSEDRFKNVRDKKHTHQNDCICKGCIKVLSVMADEILEELEENRNGYIIEN